jgi:hypothetical protein
VSALVRRYAARALPAGAGPARRVSITQVGEMCLKPDGRWLPFRAEEEFAVERVAFAWRARFTVARVVPLRVVDRYDAGAGRLDGRLFGVLPVMSSSGPEAAEAQVLRYLAELPWVPHALVANRELVWRDVDPTALEVSASGATVRHEFDADGDIVAAFAPERPRIVGREVVRTRWSGAFADYAVLGGVRIPTRAEVRWELPDGPFTYWRGTVTSLEVV